MNEIKAFFTNHIGKELTLKVIEENNGLLLEESKGHILSLDIRELDGREQKYAFGKNVPAYYLRLYTEGFKYEGIHIHALSYIGKLGTPPNSSISWILIKQCIIPSLGDEPICRVIGNLSI